MPTPHPRWIVDPDHPRAPPAELWAELSDAERAEILDSLPTEWPNLEEMAPEGDYHAKVVADVKDVLDGWYRRGGRAVYLATGMMVYYPDGLATTELLDRASKRVAELQDRLAAQRAATEAQRANDAVDRIRDLERLLEQARKGE